MLLRVLFNAHEIELDRRKKKRASHNGIREIKLREY